jgi:hypothetical protein
LFGFNHHKIAKAATDNPEKNNCPVGCSNTASTWVQQENASVDMSSTPSTNKPHHGTEIVIIQSDLTGVHQSTSNEQKVCPKSGFVITTINNKPCQTVKSVS